jgi:hypothetical protein
MARIMKIDLTAYGRFRESSLAEAARRGRSAARMVLLVQFFQALARNVRVDLGGR